MNGQGGFVEPPLDLQLLVEYREKRILFYWVPSHVGITVNKKADAAPKAGLLKRVTNIPVPYGDFKKHINVLNITSGNRPSNTNDIKFILNWGCSLEILESVGVRGVF